MKVLIIGSSGFVGNNLKNYLKANKITFVCLSIRERVPEKFNDDIGVVIHLAGMAHDLKGTRKESEYYYVNLGLTEKVYSAFCNSKAHTFVFMSSVKAVADQLGKEKLSEETKPAPKTAYGASKLAAERYLELNRKEKTRLIILRPCMIHGPGNKGNLNLLYNWINSGLPFPLGSFKNSRSYLGIENLCFVLKEIITKHSVGSGTYNVSDDGVISTVELVRLIYKITERKEKIWDVPSSLVKFLTYLGDKIRIPLNTERLNKLTESYTVNSEKLKMAIGKELPNTLTESLTTTINSFKNGK